MHVYHLIRKLHGLLIIYHSPHYQKPTHLVRNHKQYHINQMTSRPVWIYLDKCIHAPPTPPRAKSRECEIGKCAGPCGTPAKINEFRRVIWPTLAWGEGADANVLDCNGLLGVKMLAKFPQYTFLNIAVIEVAAICNNASFHTLCMRYNGKLVKSEKFIRRAARSVPPFSKPKPSL